MCCSDNTVSVSAIAEVIHKGIHAHELTDVIEVCACVIGPSLTSFGYGWPDPPVWLPQPGFHWRGTPVGAGKHS
jgi:hypothetical protein